MATVNPPAQWVTDQTLNPLTAVDVYVFNEDLTEAEPESTVEPEETTKSVTKSAAKSAPASSV